jgi:hypothetical protein
MKSVSSFDDHDVTKPTHPHLRPLNWMGREILGYAVCKYTTINQMGREILGYEGDLRICRMSPW